MNCRTLIFTSICLVLFSCKPSENEIPKQAESKNIFLENPFQIEDESEFEIIDNPTVSFLKPTTQLVNKGFSVLDHGYLGKVKLTKNDSNHIGLQKIANQFGQKYSLSRTTNSLVAAKIKPTITYLLINDKNVVTLIFTPVVDPLTFNVSLTIVGK